MNSAVRKPHAINAPMFGGMTMPLKNLPKTGNCVFHSFFNSFYLCCRMTCGIRGVAFVSFDYIAPGGTGSDKETIGD